MKILHPDGYEFHMYTWGGLAYLPQERCTLDKIGKYKHIIMTLDTKWEPQKYDTNVDGILLSRSQEPELPDVPCDADVFLDSNANDLAGAEEHARSSFTEFKRYVYSCVMEARQSSDVKLGRMTIPPKSILPKKPNYEGLWPHFGWVSVHLYLAGSVSTLSLIGMLDMAEYHT